MKLVARTALAVALCCVPQVALAQSVLLRLNPAAGLVSRYSTNTRVWIVSAIIPGADPDRPMVSQQSHLTQTVSSVSGRVTRITTVVDSARIQLPPGVGAGTPDLTGMRFLLSMDSRGRIQDSGIDQATVPAQLRGFEQQFEQIFAAMSLEFPEAAISPGQSWPTSNDATVAGPVGPMVTSNQGRYTLVRVDVSGGKRLAVIELAGTVSQRSVVDPERPAMMSVNVAGPVTGRFVFDLDTGRLVSMVNSTRLEGQVRIGNSTQGIPILIRSETTVDLLAR